MEGPHEEVLAKGFEAQLAQKVEKAEKMSHPAIVSFASLRAEVFDAVTRTDKSRGVPWERFPVLTSILGGFRDGELTVLTGPTGSGKTTFLSEYSLDLCLQGVKSFLLDLVVELNISLHEVVLLTFYVLKFI
jgi:twinkle protein